ncbi:MAG: hypothetical protein AAF686_06990, partial [Pseudomonadota bacterium]
MRQAGLMVGIMAILAGAAAADLLQAPAPGAFFTDRQPMFAPPATPGAQARHASLFIGEAEGGLFAALPGRLDAPLRRTGTKAARLRDLIAQAEAGRMGYDAVQYGARIKPPKRPTDMTLTEIFDWIAATPGQPHAIGRYQFIPATLRHSAKRLGIDHSTRFSPDIQDRLADLLLGDAGFLQVQKGEITLDAFKLNLARIWAGLPTKSGRSYYHGYAGNKAVISYADYARTVR